MEKKLALNSADEGQTQDGGLSLRRVYTHSKDVDTWRITCSVVSQLTHYLNLPAAWTAIKNKTVEEKFSLTSDRTQGGI